MESTSGAKGVERFSLVELRLNQTTVQAGPRVESSSAWREPASELPCRAVARRVAPDRMLKSRAGLVDMASQNTSFTGEGSL